MGSDRRRFLGAGDSSPRVFVVRLGLMATAFFLVAADARANEPSSSKAVSKLYTMANNVALGASTLPDETVCLWTLDVASGAVATVTSLQASPSGFPNIVEGSTPLRIVWTWTEHPGSGESGVYVWTESAQSPEALRCSNAAEQNASLRPLRLFHNARHLLLHTSEPEPAYIMLDLETGEEVGRVKRNKGDIPAAASAVFSPDLFLIAENRGMKQGFHRVRFVPYSVQPFEQIWQAKTVETTHPVVGMGEMGKHQLPMAIFSGTRSGFAQIGPKANSIGPYTLDGDVHWLPGGPIEAVTWRNGIRFLISQDECENGALLQVARDRRAPIMAHTIPLEDSLGKNWSLCASEDGLRVVTCSGGSSLETWRITPEGVAREMKVAIPINALATRAENGKP